MQVLSGHDRAVSCVALSTELDMAVSGSDDGSVNMYTAKEGQYVRSIRPPTFGGSSYRIQQLGVSYQGGKKWRLYFQIDKDFVSSF